MFVHGMIFAFFQLRNDQSSIFITVLKYVIAANEIANTIKHVLVNMSVIHFLNPIKDKAVTVITVYKCFLTETVGVNTLKLYC